MNGMNGKTVGRTGSLFAVLLVVALGTWAQTTKPAPGSVEPRAKKAPPAPPVDPQLPNVLIIGDSISMGYTPFVQAELRGKANVIHAPGNNAGTTLGREKIDAWLKGPKWDVIHFNWGLHDLKHVKADTGAASDDPNDPRQAEIGKYEANLRTLVPKLKTTGAKLIFATTTPYPAGVSPCRLPEDAVKYNEVAMKIARENGAAVNDLHAYALPKLAELQQPKNVHFKPEGSKALADEVVRAILGALRK